MTQENNIPKFFDYAVEESKIFDYWQKERVFDAIVDRTKEPFCVVIPPPNVTGILHMGHVLDNVPQDVMVRWHRMRGFSTLWIPGTDHAGIATQHVVEKELKKEGFSRYDVGREKFIEKVWEWKKIKGDTIINQLKRLGASCDWSRLRFTLDEGLCRAVRKAFVTYYNKGLVYRGKKMINWCPRCKTALANDEVEHQERKGHLWHLKYPIADELGNATDEYIVVATTRPETMLGDSAVAVNPKDERYFSLHGKKLVLPIKNKIIPIIEDDFVDKEFGTGLVKVTPAHDPNDYEMGLKHNLEINVVIGEDGKMTSLAGKEFEGKTREEARDAVIKKMESLGLVEKIEDYKHSVGECYRCHTIIEPYISLQWFLDMQELAKEAKKAVMDGRIEVTPESEKNDFYFWLDNIKDWCISRQLWWGHRIPVFYCQDCGEVMCLEEDPTACTKCGSKNIKQDEDVLDTWFSSQLWPFSTLGWPEKTQELDYWFPTNWLLCGRDIIFFWGARMMTASLSLMKDVPFRKLVLHGLVRDEQGRKLSKSLGNSPDVVDLFDKYGADSVRACLLPRYPMGRQDCKITEKNYEEGRSLLTKIWNATRLILMNFEETSFEYDSKKLKLDKIEDRWICSKLRKVIKEHDKFLSESNFSKSFAVVNSFFWNDYCDWFLEIIKPRLRGEKEERKYVLAVVLFVEKTILKLFHPYIPFVTEALWQDLKNIGIKDISLKDETCLAKSSWPTEDLFLEDKTSEDAINIVMGAVRSVRDFRQSLNLSLKIKLDAELKIIDDKLNNNFFDIKNDVISLTNLNSLKIFKDVENASSFIPLPFEGGICYLRKFDNLDVVDVKEKLNSKITKINKSLDGLLSKLSNENFVKNAPKELVEENQKIVIELNESVEKLKIILASL